MVRRGTFCTILISLLTAACDDSPTSGSSTPTTTTTTTAPASSASAFLRAAQLANDARTVDVVVNGQDRALAIPYPSVSSYIELAPGEHRVQFFPTGSRRTATIETTVTLSANEWVTVAVVGLVPLDTATFRDPPAPDSGRALVTMVNAVPDFAAPLDAAVINGPILFASVAYPGGTGAEALIPGVYDLELRRAGTSETVVVSSGNSFAAGRRYTLFAAGTFRRNDIRMLVASDTR